MTFARRIERERATIAEKINNINPETIRDVSLLIDFASRLRSP
jgi:hypothetical protein